jgi:hypothetical protein
MKTGFLGLIIVVSSVTFAPTQGKAIEQNKIEGTWELVSRDVGNFSERMREIKLISPKHFVWVVYDIKKRKPLFTGGGSYTLTGESYTEHMDFMDGKGAEALVGKDQVFTLKIDGEILVLSGTLSDGEKLGETWRRVD